MLRVTAAEGGVVPNHPDGVLVTQANFGELAHVSRPHVNRVPGDFMKMGWISKRYQRLRVLDVEVLRTFAGAQS